MRTSKKIYLAIAAAIFVGGGATTMALASSKPQAAGIKTVSTIIPSVDSLPKAQTGDSPAPAVTVQPAPIAPVSTQQSTDQPVEIAPPLKDEVAQKVRAKAAKDGVANVELQVYCVDKKLTDSGGYTSENIQSLDNGYFNLATPQYPNAYAYFDGGCKMIFENVGSA